MTKINKSKKILIHLFPYSFTNYDYYIREYELLEKKFKIKIFIHDLSKILYPGIRHAKVKKLKKSYKFSSLAEWKKNISKFDKKKVVILNELNFDSFNSFKIHNFLKKKNFIFFVNLISGVISEQDFLNNFKKIKLKFKTVIQYPNKLFFYLKKKIISFLFYFIEFKEINLLSNCKINNSALPYRFKKKIIIKYHSNDFSNFLINTKKGGKINKPIIFLDMPGPYFHGDEALLYGINMKINIKKWYQEYNNFFDKLENFFSTKVIIIPHPKTKGTYNPFYKFRNINHELNAAAKLIPSSLFVLSGITVSTAISYAIASYKPVFFLNSNLMKFHYEKQFIHQQEVAKKIGVSCLNINNFSKQEIIKNMKIDKSLYDQYKFKFMTFKKISKKPNYDIIGELINCL